MSLGWRHALGRSCLRGTFAARQRRPGERAGGGGAVSCGHPLEVFCRHSNHPGLGRKVVLDPKRWHAGGITQGCVISLVPRVGVLDPKHSPPSQDLHLKRPRSRAVTHAGEQGCAIRTRHWALRRPAGPPRLLDQRRGVPVSTQPTNPGRCPLPPQQPSPSRVACLHTPA